MPIVIAPSIKTKLDNKTPPVSQREIEQCFDNRPLGLLQDIREKNKTNPPTMWFIAPTNKNRLLKIVFVQKGQNIYIKTAYDPNPLELKIYIEHG